MSWEILEIKMLGRFKYAHILNLDPKPDAEGITTYCDYVPIELLSKYGIELKIDTEGGK